MRVAIIGRTEILYAAAKNLKASGHEIGLILTAKEAPEYTMGAAEFQALAAEWRVPFLKTAKSAQAVELIRTLAPMDIGVSLNYSGIIPESVISLFRLGVLNAHGGDLPRYRGNACQAWAILNGEDRIGLCVHRMVGGELDSGDIVAREYLPIHIDTKVTEVWTWMAERIPPLFVQAVDALGSDSNFCIERQSKDPGDALRCYPRTPADGRIDWRAGAEQILRLINASNRPYAGAYCEYEGQKLIIWDARLQRDGERFLAVPGQVTAIDGEEIDVATGDGKLRVRKVQLGEEVLPPGRLIPSIRRRLT